MNSASVDIYMKVLNTFKLLTGFLYLLKTKTQVYIVKSGLRRKVTSDIIKFNINLFIKFLTHFKLGVGW